MERIREQQEHLIKVYEQVSGKFTELMDAKTERRRQKKLQKLNNDTQGETTDSMGEQEPDS